MVSVLFKLADGVEQRITARVGFSLMESAKASDVPGILADCGGACACATCHVVVDEDWYPQLPPPATHECDMLEFALDAQPTSRLSCQIKVDESLEGLVVSVPGQ
jgi:ferredoxin, 2Fe-2S